MPQFSAQSSNCQSSFVKSFCYMMLKMRPAGRSRKYCRRIGTLMSRLARARKVVRESRRNTPCAAFSGDLSHRIEPHEEGTGA